MEAILETGDSKAHGEQSAREKPAREPIHIVAPAAVGPVHRRAAQLPEALANGRYELVEFVSKGGMGAVYRARDVELGRWVAVKCLLDVSRETSRQLAAKEARTLALLSHPNIMRVFDILTVGDQVWIVSEWLEGRCLAQLPLPLGPAAVLAIMAQVYDALSAAHDALVIHRDIKPANIMIGVDGRVTLIDFGVAFAPGASTGATLAGSLRYTDPRILEGETPDALADLFSASLLQVELMTGETVLPDLAPLPLYRHIKKNLGMRLDCLLDGSYPPLASLSRALTKRVGAATSHEGGTPARQASAAVHDLLRKLTPLSPAQYLEAAIARGSLADPEVDVILSTEADERIASKQISPKHKAGWVAFKAALATGDAVLAELREKRQRREAALTRPGRRVTEPEPHSKLLALLAVAVLLLSGIVIWMVTSPGQAHVVPIPAQIALDPPSAALAPGPEALPPWVPSFAAEPEVQLPPFAPTSRESAASSSPLQGLVALQLSANAWAVVVIDGKVVGRLPQAAPFHMTPGRHTVRLENPSVDTLVTDVSIQHGGKRRMHFNLKPKVTPRLIRLARPGRLVIDGRDHGLVVEKTLSLSYGIHQIEIERGNRIVKSTKLALGPESPKTIALE